MWAIYWLIVLLFPTKQASAAAEVKPNCASKCGNISIPYPFGIGDANCALHSSFRLNCSSKTEELTLGEDIWVKNISVENGTITISTYAAYDCYDKYGNHNATFEQFSSLGPCFTFSATENKYIAIGCDTFATLINENFTYGTSCLSICDEPVILTENSTCSGSGCCETSIARNLKSLFISADSLFNYMNVSAFNLCGFSFLADKNSFKPSDWNLSWSGVDASKKKSDVVVEWVVETIESCDAAIANKSSYACGDNTECVYSDSGEGYRCSCRDGFQGNPYLPFGCQDINECKEPEKYPCSGKCKNTVGNYTCQCPLGMHGDGKIGCQGFRVTAIVAVIGASSFLVIVAGLLNVMWMRRKKEQIFRENGGLLLKHQRVRLFSESELAKATKNYDKNWFLGEGGFGSVHKGVLPDNTIIAVKRPKELGKGQIDEECQHEIGIVSRVNHKNVVKILGLCLETKVPLLVYEFISNGTLFQHIHNSKSQILKSWRNRLRIAVETASALDYLHSLADPPIIHGDVKSMNILLDNNYTAKVSDFGASVLVSPDQKNIIATKIQGTLGYLDPEYLMTGILTEQSDVYSFGVVLVELLTGERPGKKMRNSEKRNIIQDFISSLENNELEKIICFGINQDEMEEIKEFSEIAKGCLNPCGTRRPRMKDVAEGLGNLWKLHESIWCHQNDEETDHLLSEEIDGTNAADTFSVTTFSLEYTTR